MRFSQYAGVAIIPTLSRIVLCAAFFSQGYIKCFTDAEYTPEQATKLIAMGVKVVEVEEPVKVEMAASAPAVQGAGEGSASAATSQPVVTHKVHKATAMYHVALLLDHYNWPAPKWQALLAAVTELVGGALLLVGFLTRVWGLGLSISMGVAFYLVTMRTNNLFGTMPLDFAHDLAKFNTMFCQLGLFVLAFGLFLAGAGPLSLDRWLFAGNPELGPGHEELPEHSLDEPVVEKDD
ncbi:MAG TPA: DoxX family protein [Phycisphaerales bacterium]|nr:DoxX family protein [Phycisphaerales bacterium]